LKPILNKLELYIFRLFFKENIEMSRWNHPNIELSVELVQQQDNKISKYILAMHPATSLMLFASIMRLIISYNKPRRSIEWKRELVEELLT
jgi:hypothetical protein